ncbi:DUF1501 domain-containing protein [Sphingoaurantiacus capsulatus]|uniref:DUF1501 domain-containing protein n=1 Tax=Sphingoaurantiacus capsulatus TaxID=1771310 RepID=A0ABV7XC14_9SPHN
MTDNQSRRAFLKRAGAFSLMGTAGSFVTNLAGIGEAAAATAADYKALVCVFLFGGNDNGNTLVPYDQTNYNSYATLRQGLATARGSLTPTLLNPSTALPGGLQFALAPALAPLLPLFDAGKMAVMLNTGTLIEPLTKQQYQAKSARIPPKLFSHNDQTSYWQAGAVEGAPSGWGGRMGDLFQAGNGTSTLTCINASGNAVYLSGQTAVQYAVSTGGPIALNGNRSQLFGSTVANQALRNIMAAPTGNLIADEHAKVAKRSLDAYSQVTSALGAAPAMTDIFPTNNSLADQLRVVARLISVSQELGAKRQVFFVSMGGFDNHSALNGTHPTLLGRVAAGMKAFHDATVQLGVADKVTAFTASDFGRTISVNGDGSDHGWGATHFVVGGAVNGKRFYGTAPTMAHNGPDDLGLGRFIPTTSVDQYAATLASWFGVAESDLPTVLPNIVNYTNKNLGFV